MPALRHRALSSGHRTSCPSTPARTAIADSAAAMLDDRGEPFAAVTLNVASWWPPAGSVEDDGEDGPDSDR